MIASTLPPERWYSAAVVLTRIQWALCRALWWRPDIALRNSVFLDLLLLELMQFGTFPIRWTIDGAEHLPRGGTESEGVLYCTAHLPLFAAITRVLHEVDAAPSFVIALQGAISADGTYPKVGLSTGVPALPPGARGMVRAMRGLQNGGIVGCLMDEYPGGPLKPQLFRLAGKVGARVVLLFSELDDQNRIKLTVALPPFPECATDEQINANLADYNALRQRILRPFHGNDKSAQPRPS